MIRFLKDCFATAFGNSWIFSNLRRNQLLPSTSWLHFGNTSQDATGLLLLWGHTTYSWSTCLPGHPDLFLQSTFPSQVQHNDILEVHGVPISPWLQLIKVPLSKIFVPLPKHINPFLQFEIFPQLFEVQSGSSSRSVTKKLKSISPSIDPWGKLLSTSWTLYCWSQTFKPNGPASFPLTLQPTYPFHMSTAEP